MRPLTRASIKMATLELAINSTNTTMPSASKSDFLVSPTNACCRGITTAPEPLSEAEYCTPQLGRNAIHVGAGLIQRDTPKESSHDSQKVLVAHKHPIRANLLLQGNPEVSITVSRRLEILRHHANHVKLPAVEGDRSTHDVRIAHGTHSTRVDGSTRPHEAMKNYPRPKEKRDPGRVECRES